MKTSTLFVAATIAVATASPFAVAQATTLSSQQVQACRGLSDPPSVEACMRFEEDRSASSGSDMSSPRSYGDERGRSMHRGSMSGADSMMNGDSSGGAMRSGPSGGTPSDSSGASSASTPGNR